MAESTSFIDTHMKQTIEQLKSEITCTICHELYSEPKVLPCCHYYCKQCIFRIALRTGIDKPFSCPECHKEAILPKCGVDHLQTAFFVKRMKEVHSKLQKAHSKVQAKCEMCTGGKVKAFCQQCGQFICTDCSKRHQKMKISSGHRIISLLELKEGGAREIIMMECMHQLCKEHKEPMKLYCFDCSCLICRDCTVIDHVSHDFEFSSKAAPEVKKKLFQHLHQLKDVRGSLSHAMEEVQTTQLELRRQGNVLTRFLDKSFRDLENILHNHKDELQNVALTKVAHKMDNLSDQRKSLSTSFVATESVIQYIEQCVQHSNDDEVMCMHGDIQSRIDREIKEHYKEGRSLEPVEEVDVGVEVSCAEDLYQICQAKARVLMIPIDPNKCTVTGEGMKAAEVNKPSSFFLTSKLYNGTPTKQMCAVDCQFKSLSCAGSIVKCEIYRTKASEYRIQYTPAVSGDHELVLTINGQEVAGSPFPVSVTKPREPSQLGNPTHVIEGFNLPYGVAVNLDGEIIVTEIKGGVVVLDKEGRKLRSVDLSDHNIARPTGVAVDNSGCMYIADHERCRIVKFGRELDVITTNITKQDSKLFGVAVVGDEVMVCDSKNNCIMVYTKELVYVRQFGSQGGGESGNVSRIQDLSADERGNLYISDSGNSCIQVLSNDGRFLRTFGCDKHGSNKLKDPSGICVSGQYVYVADYNSRNVSVYTTEGDHVTSFGKEGHGRGDFDRPRGVCVDKDDCVYVCDCGNNRVQVF